MNTNDETRHKLLAELLEQSARIDVLVMHSKQAASVNLLQDYELEELRVKQKETTKKLHALEQSSSNAWENIGDGG